MSNDDCRPALAQLEQSLLNYRFCGVVKRARRLVQNENGRIFEEHARDAQPLFLTARQFDASLTDLGVVALGQTSDIRIYIRLFCRLDDFLVGCVFLAVRDVLFERTRK